MIICSECGTRNQDGERFCGTCGSFLEWKEGTNPAPGPHTGDSSSDAGSGSRIGPETVRSAPAAIQPTEVSQQPKKRPIEEFPEEPTPTGGGQLCPRCGIGNELSRRFCRSCGSPLAVSAAPADRRSWWRRLVATLRTRRQAPSRRDRAATATARRILLIIALICLFTVLAVVGPPLAKRAVNEIRDRTQEHVPLTPVRMAASSAHPTSQAHRIADGATNHYWAPAGPAVKSWVEVTFANPVRLLDVVITPGISTDRSKFLTVARPEQMTIVGTRGDGRSTSATIRLRDKPGPQEFDVEMSDVVRVRLVVDSTYGPVTQPTVAIGEAEFFGRS